MTGYAWVSIALIVFITGCVVWLVDRQAQRNAVRVVETETWGDDEMDEHFDEARRVLDAQRTACAFCGRNAGHNAGCPSVRRHRAVRDGGET